MSCSTPFISSPHYDNNSITIYNESVDHSTELQCTIGSSSNSIVMLMTNSKRRTSNRVRYVY